MSARWSRLSPGRRRFEFTLFCLVLQSCVIGTHRRQTAEAATTVNVAVLVRSADHRRSFSQVLKNLTLGRDLKMEITWISINQTSAKYSIETTASLTAALVDKKIKAILGASPTCDTVGHLAAAWAIPFVTFDCAPELAEDARAQLYPTTILLDTTRRVLSQYVCQLLVVLSVSKCVLASSDATVTMTAHPAFLSSGASAGVNFTAAAESSVGLRLLAEGSRPCVVFLGTVDGLINFLRPLKATPFRAPILHAIVASIEEVNLSGAAHALTSGGSLKGSGIHALHVIAPASSINVAPPHSEKSVLNLIDSMNIYLNAIDLSFFDDSHLLGRSVVQSAAGRCVRGQGGYDICITTGHDYLGNYSVWTLAADDELQIEHWHRSASFAYSPGAASVELRREYNNMSHNFLDNGTLLTSERPVADTAGEGYTLIICIVLLVLLVGAAALIVWCEYRRRRAGIGKRSGQTSSSWLIPGPAIQQFYDVEEVEALCSLDGSVAESRHMSMCEVEARIGVITDFGYFHDRPVSLKKFSRGAFVVSKAVSRELSYMVSLHHENISTFYGVCLGDHSPEIILVTEYCIKGSLEEILILDAVRLDDMFVASLMMDLVRGMTFIHESSIGCHGNLKSSNCLVTGRWVLKLADFGLSSLRMKYRSEKSLLWCAPEVIRKIDLASKKADAYSFGVILFEIIGRKGPIGRGQDMNAYDIKAYIQKVLEEGAHPDTSWLTCEEYLKSVMLSCWQLNPRQRPDFLSLCQTLKPMRSALKGRSIVDNMLVMMERYQQKLEEQVEARTSQLNLEKRRTEALLYRMLPRQVANQLIANRVVVPEAFSCITVLFSDICGFTALAASWTPMEVIALLNDLYTTFDNIISNYDVYKVETVGDAYMVASGLPVPNGDRHASEIAYMALDFRNALKNFKVEHNDYNGHLQMRIGINSGPCVAGVVGVAMPRYTLFGDTINIASRLETTSEPMKIQCSLETKLLLDNLGGFVVERRGFVTLKGKGEMESFWLVAPDRARHPRTASGSPSLKQPQPAPSLLAPGGGGPFASSQAPASSKSSLLSCGGAATAAALDDGPPPLYRTLSVRSHNSTCSYSPGLSKPVATVLLKAGSFRKRVYQMQPEESGTPAAAVIAAPPAVAGASAAAAADVRSCSTNEIVPLITFSDSSATYSILREKL